MIGFSLGWDGQRHGPCGSPATRCCTAGCARSPEARRVSAPPSCTSVASGSRSPVRSATRCRGARGELCTLLHPHDDPRALRRLVPLSPRVNAPASIDSSRPRGRLTSGTDFKSCQSESRPTWPTRRPRCWRTSPVPRTEFLQPQGPRLPALTSSGSSVTRWSLLRRLRTWFEPKPLDQPAELERAPHGGGGTADSQRPAAVAHDTLENAKEHRDAAGVNELDCGHVEHDRIPVSPPAKRSPRGSHSRDVT